MIGGNPVKIIRQPNGQETLLSAHVHHVVVVAVAKALELPGGIVDALLALVLLNKHILSYLESIFTVEASSALNCISGGIEGVVEKVSVACVVGALDIDLNAGKVAFGFEVEAHCLQPTLFDLGKFGQIQCQTVQRIVHSEQIHIVMAEVQS